MRAPGTRTARPTAVMRAFAGMLALVVVPVGTGGCADARVPAPAALPAAAPVTRSVDCQVPPGAVAARVLVVLARGTRAEVSACRREGAGYRRDLGPYAGRVGRGGVARSGTKREGDGRTPAGTFPLREGFGTAVDPGLRLGWFAVDGRDVWVDDPASPLYNTRQRAPARGRWASAERLRIRAYRLAQVIGYNEERTAGLGSAIFLHLDTGQPTAGCVAVSATALRAIMRWERPGTVISIR